MQGPWGVIPGGFAPLTLGGNSYENNRTSEVEGVFRIWRDNK